MTIQLSVAVRNAELDAIEATIGVDPLLQIFDGALPANCAAADSGTMIAEGTLPTDWMDDAASGSKAKLGVWEVFGLPAAGAGTDGVYFRIKDATGTVCGIQGTFGEAGTEDMVADNSNIADTQVVTVVTFTFTAGNA